MHESGGHFLSVVVPLRDEEDNVLPLATQVQAALAGAPWPWWTGRLGVVRLVQRVQRRRNDG
jgi:hypothetical protein